MSEQSYIKTLEGIPVYANPNMEKDKFLVLYKKSEILDPGYVYTPTEIWNEGIKNAVGSPIEKDEVDRILKMKRDRKLSDVIGLICNSPEEDIDKIIQILYKKFKP